MTNYSALPEVLIDGEPLGPEAVQYLSTVEVDSRAGLPVMVMLELRDPQRSILQDAGIGVGSKLEILAGRVDTNDRELLAAVEVTTLEVTYSDMTSHVSVRGYDVSHRLQRGRLTRSFSDVTDGDIVKEVAGEAGVDVGRVDDPGIVREHVPQLNVSDWDFLTELARESNRVLSVRDGSIEFLEKAAAATAPAPGELSSDEVRQLVLGTNVQAFQARVTSAELPSEVQARAWSPATKQPLTSTTAPVADGIDIGLSLDDLRKEHGSSLLVTARRPADSQEEVDALAAALAEAAGVGYATATAVCRGDPSLIAGVTVSVGLAGEIFTGRWTVTAARHSFDRDGYRTQVQLGGTGEHGQLLDFAGPNPVGGFDQRSLGVVPGLVTDISDEQAMARVRVAFPWLSDDYVSDWIRVVHAGAGDGRGAIFLPEVDDEVLVAFEQGDPRRPYVLGSLYNGEAAPPLDGGAVDTSSGSSTRRGIASPSDHRVILDDGQDSPGIRLVTSGGLEISMNDKSPAVTISTGRGDVSVEGGAVKVSGLSLELTGDSEISISAPTISVEADGALTLKGATVNIN